MLVSLQSNCFVLQLGLGNMGLGLGGVRFDGQLFGSLEELIQVGVGGLVGGGGGLNLGQLVILLGVIVVNLDLVDEGGVDLVMIVMEELGLIKIDMVMLMDVLMGIIIMVEDVVIGMDIVIVMDGLMVIEMGVVMLMEGEVEEIVFVQVRVSRRRRVQIMLGFFCLRCVYEFMI